MKRPKHTTEQISQDFPALMPNHIHSPCICKYLKKMVDKCYLNSLTVLPAGRSVHTSTAEPNIVQAFVVVFVFNGVPKLQKIQRTSFHLIDLWSQ